MLRQTIIVHNRFPVHKKTEVDSSLYNFVKEGVDSMCGDDVTLYLNIKDNIITDGCFTGNGCAVSQASADVMLDYIIGKSVSEALEVSKKFENIMKGDCCEDDQLSDFISVPSARKKCALLGWKTLKEIKE